MFVLQDSSRASLLAAALEAIHQHRSTAEQREIFLPYCKTLLPLLLENASREDEGVRVLVSECLGSLVIISSQVLSDMSSRLSDSNADVRGVLISALRFALPPASPLSPSDGDVEMATKGDTSIFAALKEALPTFLFLLEDENLVSCFSSSRPVFLAIFNGCALTGCSEASTAGC